MNHIGRSIHAMDDYKPHLGFTDKFMSQDAKNRIKQIDQDKKSNLKKKDKNVRIKNLGD